MRADRELLELLAKLQAEGRVLDTTPAKAQDCALLWACACGWRGNKTGLKPSPSGSLVCPVCGGSGGLISQAVPPGYTEADFTAEVLSRALACGWRRAHFRPAQTARGWRTAVAGDGKGFLDLVLLRGPRLVVAELKMPGNEPTPEQLQWLDAWRQIPAAEVHLWYYPSDWPLIEETLR